MKDYIALVTVELHKFARQISGDSSRAGGGSGRCVGWGQCSEMAIISTVTIDATAIDKSGKCWVGASLADIGEYLEAYSANVEDFATLTSQGLFRTRTNAI